MSDREQERAAIGQLVDSVMESWNCHRMADHNAAFAADADFINVVGMHWRGREEIAARHVELHATIFRDSHMRLLELSQRFLAPVVALAHIHWAMTGAQGVPGWDITAERQGRLTWVLMKQQDGWRIAAAHNTDILPVAMPKPADVARAA